MARDAKQFRETVRGIEDRVSTMSLEEYVECFIQPLLEDGEDFGPCNPDISCSWPHCEDC